MATSDNHFLQYLGNTGEYFLSKDIYLKKSEILDYRKLNESFGNLYVKLYNLDTKHNENYLKIIDGLKDKFYKMNNINDNYTSARRIKKEIESYLDKNRVNDFQKVTIFNTLSKDLDEYKTIKYARIIDEDYKIKKQLDAQRYLGQDSPIKKIYTLNKVEPINDYPSVSISYEFNGLATLNLFQTKFLAEKYEIYDIKLYNKGTEITEKYELEKLRDNVCIIFERPVTLTDIVITYYVITKTKLEKTCIFSIGETIHANKKEYSDIVEYVIENSSSMNKFVLDKLGYEKFLYITTPTYQYCLPSVNDENKRSVNRLYYFTEFGDITIPLFPIPDDMSLIKVVLPQTGVTLDVTEKTVGNSIFLNENDLNENNISIGTKLFISYDTSDSVSKYYTNSYIDNKLIFSTKGDKITAYTEGSSAFNTIVSTRIPDFYSRKKTIIRNGVHVDTILYDPNVSSDYRDIIRTEQSTPLYFYKSEKVSIPNNTRGDIKITISENYLPGSLTVLNEDRGEFVNIPYKDWVDANLSVDTDKDKLIVTIDNPNIIVTVDIYYIPLSMNKDDLTVVSNINNVKTKTVSAPIVSGKCGINVNDFKYDKYLVDTWTLEKNIYKHPIYDYIYYELVSSTYNIKEIQFQNDTLVVSFEDESLNDEKHSINCFPKENNSVMNVNYKYILPESNPVLVVE